MKCVVRHALFLMFVSVAVSAWSADVSEKKGWVTPIIEGYGKVLPYPDAPGQLDPERTYKVIFNVKKGAGDKGSVNPGLVRVARFLNLAGLVDVPADKLKLVVMIQGPATSSVLSQKAYRALHQSPNPNLELISALKDAGVEIMVCGQALAHHGIEPSDVLDQVQVAVAGLTVVADYQLDGYALLPL